MNKDLDQIEKDYRSKQAANHGSMLHDFAATCIRLNQRLEDLPLTLNMYVKDAINFRMTPEQGLYVSPDAFGTADAISFHDNFLRIHDLKTGITEASFMQLYGYAAYFCIEYDKDPKKLDGIEFRIYQHDTFKTEMGDPLVVQQIMETTKFFVPHLAQLRKEAQ